MEETRFILTHCNEFSLVAMDELGRGTSTYDGMSLACATLKFMISRGCLCLFTTHFDIDKFLSQEDKDKA